MSKEFTLDLQTQLLYTIQDSVSPLDIWNKIQFLRAGGEFRPSVVHYAKDIGEYCLTSSMQDPVAIESRIDGGNHRAVACAIEDKPYPVRTPAIRRTIRRLPFGAAPITTLKLTDNTSELTRNKILYPQYYTEVPTDSDIEYMQERLDYITNKSS